jgi:hypothetical protein
VSPASTFKEQAVELTHNAAEGVAVGSICTFIGAVVVAFGDVIYNVGHDALAGGNAWIGPVGIGAAIATGLGFGALIASALTLRFTDRARGSED